MEITNLKNEINNLKNKNHVQSKEIVNLKKENQLKEEENKKSISFPLFYLSSEYKIIYLKGYSSFSFPIPIQINILKYIKFST